MSQYRCVPGGSTEDRRGCSEAEDPSLNGSGASSLDQAFGLTPAAMEASFFQAYGLEYVPRDLCAMEAEWRVVTHPRPTTTCFEKAELLGWSPLNVIKALYFEDVEARTLYAVVVPETGCFVDRAALAQQLGVEERRLRKANRFPRNMERGTCSPFVSEQDWVQNAGPLAAILFDAGTLAAKEHDAALDDFSFGLDHRMSIQLNYHRCFEMLARRHGDAVRRADLLRLAFRELLVRDKGRLKITYEFQSLNYRVAAMLNGIHGYGDVTVVNDHVDELDLPDVVRRPRPRAE